MSLQHTSVMLLHVLQLTTSELPTLVTLPPARDTVTSWHSALSPDKASSMPVLSLVSHRASSKLLEFSLASPSSLLLCSPAAWLSVAFITSAAELSAVFNCVSLHELGGPAGRRATLGTRFRSSVGTTVTNMTRNLLLLWRQLADINGRHTAQLFPIISCIHVNLSRRSNSCSNVSFFVSRLCYCSPVSLLCWNRRLGHKSVSGRWSRFGLICSLHSFPAFFSLLWIIHTYSITVDTSDNSWTSPPVLQQHYSTHTHTQYSTAHSIVASEIM